MQSIHALEPQDVFVDEVEEDRVVQHAEHLRRWRVIRRQRAVGLFARARVPRRDREDACRAEVKRRRQRRGQSHAAVAIPLRAHANGGEQHGKGTGRHHVFHGDRREFASALRPLPERDVAPLDPRDGLASGVTRRGERDGVESTGADVVLDSGQRAVSVVWQGVLEETASVGRCPAGRASAPCRPCAPADQAHSPATHVRQERQRLDVVDLVRRQAEPQPDELLGGFRQWAPPGRPGTSC